MSSHLTPSPPRPIPPPQGAPYLDYGPALPARYGLSMLRAMVRDPRAVFAYWEWPGGLEAGAIRLRDVQNGDGEVLALDREGSEKGSRYLPALPDREYEVEFGTFSQGRFYPRKASNRVRTPRDGPSSEVDREWELSPEEREVWAALSGTAGFSGSFLPGHLPGSRFLGSSHV